MWHLFNKVGIVAIPLVICSMIGLVIVVERILFYMRNARLAKDDRQFNLLKQLIHQQKLTEARTLALRWNSALARIVETVLNQWETGPNPVENAAQHAGENELQHYQRGLGILDTIVTASPLLGLLGTVTGIIKSFTALSKAGGAHSMQLSAGIAEALYSTAFGLAIAIPALFCVNIFYNMADRAARDLTLKVQEVIAILQGIPRESIGKKPSKEAAPAREG